MKNKQAYGLLSVLLVSNISLVSPAVNAQEKVCILTDAGKKACGTLIVSAQPDNTNLPSSSAASQVEFLNGTWEGTYVCLQGLTNLKLVVKAKSTTEIDAVFLFSAHPQNPNIPSGRFRMTGNLEILNSKDMPNLLDLKATTWINRPADWLTVDLRGDISSSKRRITGNVLTPGCSTFDVVKRER
jgi:hypothetical protein